MFYVLDLGHIFVKCSIIICRNINKLTYLLTYLLMVTVALFFVVLNTKVIS